MCSLTSSPEDKELKSVPLDTAENNLVKASVGKELETAHLNEGWDYMWIIIDGVLNKNITEYAHYFRHFRVMFSRFRKVIQNGVQLPLITITFKENFLKKMDSERLLINSYSAYKI